MNLYTPGLQNFVAALIPMILGMVWFHPKAFGNAWMKGANVNPDDGKAVNMPLLMGIGFVMALVISCFLKSYAIYHEGTPADATFAHGAFHGVMFCLMLGVPVLVSATIWEKKSLSYYLINISYWVVVFALMGGLMFAWRSGYAEIAASMNAGG